MITQILLTQTFIMFILMILGLIMSKTGLLTEHGSKDMAIFCCMRLFRV